MRILSLTKHVTLKAACVMLVAALAGPALAADAAPMKVGVLDMAGALFNSERAKVVTAQMQEDMADDEAKVRQLAQEATGLQQKLQQDNAVMSDDEKRKANDQIQEISVQYQFLVEKLQTAANARREEFQQTHAQSLITAIQTVIEEGGYDLVVRAEAALYFNPDYDITARVTEKLNQQP